MRAFLLLVLAAGLGLAPAHAQQRVTVAGSVVDTTQAPLAGATVVLVQAADSALVSFGVTRADGAFVLRRVPAGSFLLQVTFVGYASYAAPLDVAGENVDVGAVVLREAVEDLGELVVSAERIPMVIKDDTLEYNAAAFATPAGATVEDLLRRLPGLEVERDGTIKAQGENVQKVLVDGKEFFGNDPKIATKNLSADAVEKVQVFDKKSDQAEFSGVDDGQEERTINLTLRPDRRNGYFGNLSGGLGGASAPGSEPRFDSRLNLNRFSPSAQFSVIGNFNNVNQQGFEFGEFMNFMGGMGAMMRGGDGFSLPGDLPIGTSLSDGFSTTLAGGVNFNRDFTSKTELRSNYFLSFLDNEQDSFVRQQQVFGEAATSLAEQTARQDSRNVSHRLGVDVRHAFAEGRDLRLRTQLQATTSAFDTAGLRVTQNGAGAVENESQTAYGADRLGLSGSASLTYRTRFAGGRSLVAEARAQLQSGDTEAALRATNRFYRSGDLLTSEEIDQLQDATTDARTLAQKLTYTEPLGRGFFGQLEAEHRRVQEDETRQVFDVVSGERVRNALLSSAFDKTYRYLVGGATLRANAEGRSASVGVDVQHSRLDAALPERDASIGRGFVHLLPSAFFRHEFAQGRTLSARYRASTREPRVRDLQPVIDNSDPLNVYVGNPDLRPEYTHNLSASYLLFDQFTFTNLFVSARAAYTFSKIARSRTVDAQFRQTLTPVNVDGDWSVSGNVTFGTPVRPLGISVEVTNQTAFNRGVEFINGAANTSNLLRSTVGLELENRVKDQFDVEVGARYTFNDVRYSLGARLDQQYVNRTYYGQAAWTPPGGWRFATGLDYTRYADEVFGDGRSVPLWRAEASKTLFGERLQVQLVALDLLDQNQGIQFTNTNTYIQEERVESLGRYAMLKLVYSLKPGGGQARGGAVRVFGR